MSRSQLEHGNNKTNITTTQGACKAGALGHSDIRITLNTYCDAFESFQRENIAMADEYLASMGISFGKPRLLKTAG